MALTEHTIIDQISADEYGNINVRQRTDILRDGEVVSFSYHRHVIAPGDDLKGEDKRVQAHAKLAHTPENIAAHKKRVAEAAAQMLADKAEAERRDAEAAQAGA